MGNGKKATRECSRLSVGTGGIGASAMSYSPLFIDRAIMALDVCPITRRRCVHLSKCTYMTQCHYASSAIAPMGESELTKAERYELLISEQRGQE